MLADELRAQIRDAVMCIASTSSEAVQLEAAAALAEAIDTLARLRAREALEDDRADR